MSETGYLVAFISVAAIATFATRIIPFLFFERHTEHPLIKHLGRYLPLFIFGVAMPCSPSRRAQQRIC